MLPYYSDAVPNTAYTKVYIGNLHFEISRAQVEAFLSNLGFGVVQTYIARKGRLADGNTCAALITMSSRAAASQLIAEIDGLEAPELGPRTLQVEMAKNTSVPECSTSSATASSGYTSATMCWTSTVGGICVVVVSGT